MKGRIFIAVLCMVLCGAVPSLTVTKAADTKKVEPVVEHGIIGPNESVPGDLCKFHANVPEGATVCWAIVPPEAWSRLYVDSNGRMAVFASRTPGTYYIAMAAVVGDDLAIYTHTLVNGGPGPEPKPDPKPDPEPEPEPEPGRRFVLVIAESSERTPERASLLMGLRGYVKDKHDFRFMDPDATNAKGETPEWLQGYLDSVAEAKVELPALVVGVLAQNSDDEVTHVFVDPLPETAKEAIEIIKKHGG